MSIIFARLFSESSKKSYAKKPREPAKIGLPQGVATLKCPRYSCRLVAVFVPLRFFLNPDLQALAFCSEPTQEKADSQLTANLPFTLKNWRRERDSNPRSLAAQRFSRPPRSTTLPSLLIFILFIKTDFFIFSTII